MKTMIRMANFTRHYPRFQETLYWRKKGYVLDATPRIPSIDSGWQETEIAEILRIELAKAKAQGFEAILIAGMTNIMAYAWFIAANLGLEVFHAKGKQHDNKGFVVFNHSKLLAPVQVAKAA